MTTAASSIDLPAGAKFAQYTVGEGGGTATFHIDWGDGAVSDGTVISSGNTKYAVQGEHTYSAAGWYRVTAYVVINAADNTLLHVDRINSTARVPAAAGGGGGMPATIRVAPAHSQVSWSDVLPAGTTLQAGPPTGETGGTQGSGGTISGGQGGGTDGGWGKAVLQRADRRGSLGGHRWSDFHDDHQLRGGAFGVRHGVYGKRNADVQHQFGQCGTRHAG